jgi:hypothetical protein
MTSLALNVNSVNRSQRHRQALDYVVPDYLVARRCARHRQGVGLSECDGGDIGGHSTVLRRRKIKKARALSGVIAAPASVMDFAIREALFAFLIIVLLTARPIDRDL